MLGVSSRRSDRFRLVNLEEGEYLLEEVEATIRVERVRDREPLPALNRGKAADGRLRVCTRGLLFEPDDRSLPMMRFSWRDMEGEPEAVRTAAGLQLTCQVRSVTTLKANNVVAPYSEEAPAGGGAWAPIVAAVESDDTDQLVALLKRLWSISDASGGRGGPRESKLLEPLIRQRWEGPFDAALVRDFSERRLLDEPILCELIAPLVSCPGRLMVTNAAVYFQHASLNHADRTLRCRRWPLPSLSMVARRRHLLQETGLELRCQADGEAAAGGGGGGSGSAGVAPPGAGVGWLGLSGETQNWARGRMEPALEAEDYGRPMSELSTAALLAFNSHADRESVLALLVSQAPAGFLRPLASVVAAADPSTNPQQEAGGSASSVPAVASAILDRQSESLGTQAQRLMDDRVGRLDGLEATALAAACRAWQEGALSTLDYLHLVNEAAGRTKLDLAQYPVFPWVVADWESDELDLQDPATFRDLSRPIAALCEDRLRAARRRMAEMPAGEGEHAPFLFGTHYSTPGYVLFFLVRSAPEHMLRLQSGEFDRADRLFLSMAGCWRGVMSNPADVKELIPEFYEGDGSFLQLHGQLHLGRSANTGDVVGDVELPPWADDGEELVRLLREALESQLVSQHLHQWIDLIFGVDQKGPRAAAKDNVFHPLTYEGTVQLASIRDPEERQAKMVQIAEFGQCPRQVFLRPHPRRTGPSLPRNPAALQHTSSALQDALANWTAQRGRAGRSRATAAAVAGAGGGRQVDAKSLDTDASSLPSRHAGSSVCSRGDHAGAASGSGLARGSSRASGELGRGGPAGTSDAASAASPRHHDPSLQATQVHSVENGSTGLASAEEASGVPAVATDAAAVAAGRWLQNGPRGGAAAPRSAAATKPLGMGWQRMSGLARPANQASMPLVSILLPEVEPQRCIISIGQEGAAAVTGIGRDSASAAKLASRPICAAAMLPGDRQMALACADGSLRVVPVSKAVSAGADAAAAAADRSGPKSAGAAATGSAGGQSLPAHAGRATCLTLLPVSSAGTGPTEALLLSGGSDGVLRGWPLRGGAAAAKRKSAAGPVRWEVPAPDSRGKDKSQDTPLHAFERSDHQRYPLTAVAAWSSRVVTGASDGSLVWYDLTVARRTGDGGAKLGFSCSPVVATSAPSTGLESSGVLGVTALAWAGQRGNGGTSLSLGGAAKPSNREALLLVGSASGCVSIYSKSADLLARIVTGEPLRSLGTGGSGNLVATGGDWGALRLWNLPAIVSNAQRAAKAPGGAVTAVTSATPGCQVAAFGIDPSRTQASLGQDAHLAASLQFLQSVSKGNEEQQVATAVGPRPSGALVLQLSADERVLAAGTTLGGLQVWHRAFA